MFDWPQLHPFDNIKYNLRIINAWFLFEFSIDVFDQRRTRKMKKICFLFLAVALDSVSAQVTPASSTTPDPCITEIDPNTDGRTGRRCLVEAIISHTIGI